MKKNDKNILITINNGYTKYAMVMLTSLFENNRDLFCVYCLYNELTGKNKELLETLVQKYGSQIVFLYVDKELYKNFPTTQALTVECYFILLAHMLLPADLERILYLDSDMIIEDSIEELYNTAFNDKYMVVCGQSYKKINGNYYKIGARPERGECFNSGVILFNLQKFRNDVTEDTYLKAAEDSLYNFYLADQGILNIVFWNKVLYVDTLKYNFRMNIYEDYTRDNHKYLEEKPIIIHYIMRDYYKIGHASKPWILTLRKKDYRLLVCAGILHTKYTDEECVKMNQWIHQRWWYYAKKTTLYKQMLSEMKKNRDIVLKQILPSSFIEILRKNRKNSKLQHTFKQLTVGSNLDKYLNDTNIKYEDLYHYIDSLEPGKAIQTMKNLFRWNCGRMSKKKKIKMAFLVYSSAEWQCEKMYRTFEKDERFEPVVVVCGYNHGTEQTIKETYIKTCAYFRNSSKKYNVIYSGYVNNGFKNNLKNFDIIIYMSPFFNMLPWIDNISERRLNQLCIHIPYAIYMVNKSDVCYRDDFYNTMLFTLGWKYYCYSAIQKEIVSKSQRLKGYNVFSSGLTKIDSLIESDSIISDKLWKQTENTCLRIIWAPHFNLMKGMNGTFHENYQWFYNFAKEHKEISWIVRPHPRMEWGAVTYGVFENGEQYKEYLKAWDDLPNARVIPDGDYYDMFLSSDTMILDCVSFLMEYQYTGKPLLMLLPETPRSLSEAGDKLVSVLYTARGNDYDAIQTFVDNMRNGNDILVEKRKEFFDIYLDYKKQNNMSATDFIYDDMVREIFGS